MQRHQQREDVVAEDTDFGHAAVAGQQVGEHVICRGGAASVGGAATLGLVLDELLEQPFAPSNLAATPRTG